MKEYLEKATDFTDFTKKTPTDTRVHPCPVCQSFGGWNLILNAYGEGKHFRASCFHCNGWGWVMEQDAKCIHTFNELTQREAKHRGISHFGMCYHVYECSKCGRIRSVDSSG